MSKIMVLWLICCPELDLEKVTPTADPITWYSFRQTAEDLELHSADTAWGTDFKTMVEYLRELHQRCCDYPPVSDLYRFPDEKLTTGRMNFSNNYLNWLEEYVSARPNRTDLAYAVEQTKELQRPWYLLSCAHYNTPMYMKRFYLREIKSLIGSDNYFRGEIPVWVPVWYFYKGK